MSSDDQELWRLSSFAGSFTLIEHAIQMLDENVFTDEELPAIKQFTVERQMRLTARLMDLAEQLRQTQRVLDWQVTVLTSGLHQDAAA